MHTKDRSKNQQSELTPDQRLREVASLLAGALIHLRMRDETAHEVTPNDPTNSSPMGLEVGENPRLTVVNG